MSRIIPNEIRHLNLHLRPLLSSPTAKRVSLIALPVFAYFLGYALRKIADYAFTKVDCNEKKLLNSFTFYKIEPKLKKLIFNTIKSVDISKIDDALPVEQRYIEELLEFGDLHKDLCYLHLYSANQKRSPNPWNDESFKENAIVAFEQYFVAGMISIMIQKNLFDAALTQKCSLPFESFEKTLLNNEDHALSLCLKRINYLYVNLCKQNIIYNCEEKKWQEHPTDISCDPTIYSDPTSAQYYIRELYNYYLKSFENLCGIETPPDFPQLDVLRPT